MRIFKSWYKFTLEKGKDSLMKDCIDDFRFVWFFKIIYLVSCIDTKYMISTVRSVTGVTVCITVALHATLNSK